MNISSLLSKVAYAGLGVQGVTKAGMDQLTRVMALELGPHQVYTCKCGQETHKVSTHLPKWPAGGEGLIVCRKQRCKVSISLQKLFGALHLEVK